MRWMWIDQIIAFEPGRSMSAIKNVSLAEEHLHDHFAPEPARGGERPRPARDAMAVMPASLMIEGMAQTAGILVGAAHKFREKVVLAKIASAVIERDVFPGQTIRYEATIERLDELGASTRGVIDRFDHASARPAWERIGQVDLMFSHLDQNRSGMQFPKENFVFSDNFRSILRTAACGDLTQLLQLDE
jgi:3-hydroxyacyl-[acyl-carrier-protein] dehydratase